MSGNGSRRPSLVFALQGGPADYRRATAERLAEATRSVLVDADGWLRVFALHAEAERVVPQIAWEVDKALKSLEWIGYEINGDTARIGGIDVSEALSSQQCVDLAEEWRAVPAVSEIAIRWARNQIERAIEPAGKVVVYGETVADNIAPKSKYIIYFDDQAGERNREAVLPFSDILERPLDPITDAAPKASLGELIRNAKASADVPVAEAAPLAVDNASRSYTVDPMAQSAFHAADQIADMFEADRYLALAVKRDLKMAQSIERHLEHENRTMLEEGKRIEMAERRAS